jgi:hypothetical protein
MKSHDNLLKKQSGSLRFIAVQTATATSRTLAGMFGLRLLAHTKLGRESL